MIKIEIDVGEPTEIVADSVSFVRTDKFGRKTEELIENADIRLTATMQSAIQLVLEVEEE